MWWFNPEIPHSLTTTPAETERSRPAGRVWTQGSFGFFLETRMRLFLVFTILVWPCNNGPERCSSGGKKIRGQNLICTERPVNWDKVLWPSISLVTRWGGLTSWPLQVTFSSSSYQWRNGSSSLVISGADAEMQEICSMLGFPFLLRLLGWLQPPIPNHSFWIHIVSQRVLSFRSHACPEVNVLLLESRGRGEGWNNSFVEMVLETHTIPLLTNPITQH